MRCNCRTPLLQVTRLSKCYGSSCPLCIRRTGPESGTNICSACGTVVACSEVELTLFQGEVLGIVGESGSGKSTLLRCLNFDEEPTTGKAFFAEVDDGKTDIFTLSAQKKRQVQSSLFGIVYQSPHLGLNLHFTAGGNVAERLLVRNNTPQYQEIRKRISSLLGKVEISQKLIDELTRVFSGGMQQRVQLAKALAPHPRLLFLDEPTSGLDVSVQASVLDLIVSLQQETGIAMLVVSHDLGVIRLLTQRTLVMKTGRIVEGGLTDQIFEDPQHNYTQQLVASRL